MSGRLTFSYLFLLFKPSLNTRLFIGPNICLIAWLTENLQLGITGGQQVTSISIHNTNQRGCYEWVTTLFSCPQWNQQYMHCFWNCTLCWNAWQFSKIRWVWKQSTVGCSTVEQRIVPCSLIQWSSVGCSVVLQSTVRPGAAQPCIFGKSALEKIKVWCNTV